MAESPRTPFPKFDDVMRASSRNVLDGDLKHDPVGRLLESYDEIYEKISIDKLTGLMNLPALEKHIENWVYDNPGRRFALIFVDLDSFKAVNDNYGHKVGDRALRKIAAGLKDAFSRDGEVVSRFGGDEFVIMIPIDDGEDAQGDDTERSKFDAEVMSLYVIEKFNSIKASLLESDRNFFLEGIGVSVGAEIVDTDELLVELAENKQAVDKYIEKADRRMYYDKASKKEGLDTLR